MHDSPLLYTNYKKKTRRGEVWTQGKFSNSPKLKKKVIKSGYQNVGREPRFLGIGIELDWSAGKLLQMEIAAAVRGRYDEHEQINTLDQSDLKAIPEEIRNGLPGFGWRLDWESFLFLKITGDRNVVLPSVHT